MATDFTKQPLEILVDLINFTNGSALTLADISFSPPSATLTGNRNTKILVTARPSSPYSGSRELTYDRVDLSIIPGLRSTSFDLTGAVTMKDVIPKINAAYHLNMQPEDYFDDVLPVFTGDQAEGYNFVLRAKPGSYVYRNKLILTAVGDRIVIGDYITQDVLNGFLLPHMKEMLDGEEILDGFYFSIDGVQIKVIEGFTYSLGNLDNHYLDGFILTDISNLPRKVLSGFTLPKK